MSSSPNRSFERIDENDLRRIGRLAEDVMMKFLARNKTGKHYGPQNLIMACLCQGAARHFVYGDCGVQDFEVVYEQIRSGNFHRGGVEMPISEGVNSGEIRTTVRSM